MECADDSSLSGVGGLQERKEQSQIANSGCAETQTGGDSIRTEQHLIIWITPIKHHNYLDYLELKPCTSMCTKKRLWPVIFGSVVIDHQKTL